MKTRAHQERLTHKYYQRASGLWFCGMPGCTHYMPANVGAPENHQSRCWVCDKDILLTATVLANHTHPTHAACGDYDPDALSIEKIAEFLDHVENKKKEEKDEVEVIEGDENE